MGLEMEVNRRCTISVAMVAYNGQKHIYEQIQSILIQLDQKDELIISLDPSSDDTKTIIHSIHDQRIQLIDGPGLGVKKNVENALKHCSNEIIFLADQDDVWKKDKVQMVLSKFDEDTCVVLHDCSIVDNDMNVLEPSFFKLKNTDIGIVHNLIKNGYIGCCMAFRKDLLKYILPIPDYIYMHDQWIGMVGDLVGKNVLIHEPLLNYRRHDENVSPMEHGNMIEMISKRWNMIRAYFELKKRVRNYDL